VYGRLVVLLLLFFNFFVVFFWIAVQEINRDVGRIIAVRIFFCLSFFFFVIDWILGVVFGSDCGGDCYYGEFDFFISVFIFFGLL